MPCTLSISFVIKLKRFLKKQKLKSYRADKSLKLDRLHIHHFEKADVNLIQNTIRYLKSEFKNFLGEHVLEHQEHCL